MLYLFPGHGRTSWGTGGSSIRLPRETNALFGWGDLTGDRPADLMARLGRAHRSCTPATVAVGSAQKLGPSVATWPGSPPRPPAPMPGAAAADVVGRDRAGRLVVVTNNGRRNLTGAPASNLVARWATQLLNVGDWDRDGHARPDHARVVGNDLLVFYPGFGNGKFGRAALLGSRLEVGQTLAAVGDVTGDGYPDLVGRVNGGPMRIIPGRGQRRDQGAGARAARDAHLQPDRPTAGPRPVRRSPPDNGSFVPLARVNAHVGTALRTANGYASADL